MRNSARPDCGKPGWVTTQVHAAPGHSGARVKRLFEVAQISRAGIYVHWSVIVITGLGVGPTIGGRNSWDNTRGCCNAGRLDCLRLKDGGTT